MRPQKGLRELLAENKRAREYTKHIEETGGVNPDVRPEAIQALYERGIREGNTDVIRVAEFRAALIKYRLIEPDISDEEMTEVKRSLGLA